MDASGWMHCSLRREEWRVAIQGQTRCPRRRRTQLGFRVGQPLTKHASLMQNNASPELYPIQLCILSGPLMS